MPLPCQIRSASVYVPLTQTASEMTSASDKRIPPPCILIFGIMPEANTSRLQESLPLIYDLWEGDVRVPPQTAASTRLHLEITQRAQAETLSCSSFVLLCSDPSRDQAGVGSITSLSLLLARLRSRQRLCSAPLQGQEAADRAD